MPEKWVMNASPLIVLGKAHLLGSISSVAQQWILPKRVIQEVRIKQAIEPFLAELASGASVVQQDVMDMSPSIAAWELGPGESAVLSIALNMLETGVVLDDLQARKCAALFGLPIIGSLGLVLLAKRRGLLPLAKPAIEQIIRAGLYVQPALIHRVLKSIGETS
jgi:predicted nucleic acid-binding protein